MSSDAFQPSGNGVSLNTSTTSASIQMPAVSPCVVITNRSQSSAWVTWDPHSPPTAVFPASGNTTGTWGMEIAPMSQVTVGTGRNYLYFAAILSSGTGVMTFVPGDGL